MFDIFEVLCYSIADRDLFRCDTQRFHQSQGILVCSVCCAKTGHCYAQNMAAVDTQEVTCFDTNQKSQCGVQTAGNTNYQRVGMCMFHSSCQTCCLDGEDVFAVFIHFICGRVERCGSQRSAPVFQRFGLFHIECDQTIQTVHFCFLQMRKECCMSAAFVCQDIQIDISIDQLIILCKTFCFCEDFAVFTDQAVAAENSILCGFADACGNIYIRSHAGRGMLCNHSSAIVCFAGQFVACGQVQQQCCAIQCPIRTGTSLLLLSSRTFTLTTLPP